MMTSSSTSATVHETEFLVTEHSAHWAARARLLWQHRRILARVAMISLAAGLCVAFAIPKQYTAVTSIMPPDQAGSSAMLLAALAGRSGGMGALGSLAGGFLGEHPTTALFITLLQSGTVSGHLIERFDLKHVYHKRYNVDTAKRLAHVTKITDDKKSGVITIKVEDGDPVRARDLAQGYLDELNRLVTQTSTSAARQERVFIEQRLHRVQADLERAQLELSEFSSKNSTIDIKEQTRAMVDTGARVQAELLVEQSGLQSLRQIYGDGNVNTTIGDMIKWDTALTEDKLVHRATLQEAFTRGALNNGTKFDYGFGWALRKRHNTETTEHNGSWVGFRSGIVRFSQRQLTIIILSNSAGFPMGEMEKKIEAIYWDEP